MANIDPVDLLHRTQAHLKAWTGTAFDWLRINPSTGALKVEGTVIVDTSSLATSAKQDVGNTSVASIDTKVGATTDARSTATDSTAASLISSIKQLVYSIIGLARISIVDAATFQRPNDGNAYLAGDAVSNNTTAGSVTPLAFTLSDVADAPIAIHSARIACTGLTLGSNSVQYRLRLYRSSPTVAAGDNAPWANPNIGAGYMGSLVGTFEPYSDGSVALLFPETGPGQDLLGRPVSGGTTVYGLLQTTTAYSPTAQSTYTVTLTGFQGRA